MTIRLGVNVDHVATLRNARGGTHPDPVAAAALAARSGADGITAHLREDRRHIRDADLPRLKGVGLPLNFEMAATEEMTRIACALKPNAACLVPERRTEVTTEGGLDAAGQAASLKPVIARLKQAGIRVSLFLDADTRQIQAARAVGADIVEIHTGPFCHATGPARDREFTRLRAAAVAVRAEGIECHAGHGLDYETAELAARIPEFVEFNIGHFIMGQAVFDGLPAVLARMRAAINAGAQRRGATPKG